MSLVIVAAVKSGRMRVPKRWRQAVQSSIATLRYWELESPDLREARIILQDIMEGLDMERNHVDFSDDHNGAQNSDGSNTNISQ